MQTGQDLSKTVHVTKRLICLMELFRKRGKSVATITRYKWLSFINTDGEVLRITHFYKHFCVLCVPCVSNLYLCSLLIICVPTVRILISQTRKNDEYYLVCEALLTDRAVFGNIFRLKVGEGFVTPHSFPHCIPLC